MKSVIDPKITIETYTGTTDAGGQLVTDIHYDDNSIDIATRPGSGVYCLARPSATGKLVVTVIDTVLRPVTNASVT